MRAESDDERMLIAFIEATESAVILFDQRIRILRKAIEEYQEELDRIRKRKKVQ
jgi:hypothetical protein